MAPRITFGCNINKWGRLLRVAIGLLFVFNGVMLYRYDLPGDGTWSRALQVAFIASGLFSIFEGAVGWCAVRALGYKTRI